MKSIIVLGAAICCSCGGTAALDPLNLTGYVSIGPDLDGGTSVQVVAYVSRPLADGGVEPAPDADLALNGVPLGTPSFVDAATGQPATFTFQGASFPGAVPSGHQTLSVIGSNPPAQISFSCPAAVRLTSPLEGAIANRNQPVPVAWSPAGQTDQVLSYAYSAGGFSGAIGSVPVDAGVSSAELSLPPDVPANASVRVTISAYGDAPGTPSVCLVSDAVDLIVP